MSLDTRDYVSEYIEEIESGRITVSKNVRKVYLEWIKPIIEDLDPKYFFNPIPGNRFIQFTETYTKQSKGEWTGKPIKLMLFQKAQFQVVFGILHRDTELRRFKQVFDLMGRKNGKSTKLAPLVLWMSLIEKGAETYVAATMEAQAKRILEEAENMINQDEALFDMFRVRKTPPMTINVKNRPSKIQVLSKNVLSQDGLNVSFAAIDEVHALGREVYDVLEQATSARLEPLIWLATTGGFIRGGLYDDLYDHCINVIEGISNDETILPLLYELDDKDEVENEEMWIKANPALGVIKKVDYLRNAVIKMESDQNYKNTVMTKDFNIRGVVNKAWLSFEILDNKEEYSDEELREITNRSKIVIGGLDLSRTGDMTAFTTLLFDKEKGKSIAITMYWITHDFYKEQVKKQNNKIPWEAWVGRGLIRISGTNLINYKDIADYIVGTHRDYGWMYQYIHYDSYSAGYLIEELAARGFSKTSVLIPTHQGAKTLSVPMQLMESHLKSKILVYQNNPVTKWCFTNIELETDRNGNYMPKKLNDQSERKIDGAATILNTYVGLSSNVQRYLGGGK